MAADQSATGGTTVVYDPGCCVCGRRVLWYFLGVCGRYFCVDCYGVDAPVVVEATPAAGRAP